MMVASASLVDVYVEEQILDVFYFSYVPCRSLQQIRVFVGKVTFYFLPCKITIKPTCLNSFAEHFKQT